MFTGIVQGMAQLVALEQPSADFRRHTIELPENMAQSLQIGASVAHNGCCLTITEFDGRRVSFDLMAETLAKTNLGSLKIGDWVNVERAARFGDEIGGHLMSGHIIATTEITRIERSDLNQTVWFRLPENIQLFVLEKGFIGLDGCSLTIGTVRADEFCVHLIPETLRQTLFGRRQVGNVINIEIDAHTQAVVETVQRVLKRF
ncbi:riboflavin synthase [Simonsiella muelleri]|uniref:Riboflavin synthase n=1 Tax=Simonsiella muelleri ATCC 29453 TaxID=641147 RepID=V9HL50_9NEIS|nr:riboflavin synthase [Simonsiella muelleri]AUX61091.1 riboflavin synthase [Simonsiella muelleri ATCC 29453]EFG30891.1 riboflavin synthase, alpha subunit [Simonsiella muelleri ATCC 29453]UBQ53140.1 riboflavin synthase [Simonsiella muelleri]